MTKDENKELNEQEITESVSPEEIEEANGTPEEPSLEEQLAEAQALAAEYLDGWQRARAELANFKRRTDTQRAEMTLSANAGLLTKLLPVLDDLQLALENKPNELAPAGEEWSEGIALISHKFLSVLENVGVKPIETAGESFDPNIHEAISYEPNPDFESGQIIAQVRPGYMLGDRVLRAPMVRVAQ